MNTPQQEPLRLHGLAFDIAGLSEQGPRPENQDAFSIDAFASTGVVAVADGMGGERSGRLAADTALHALLTASPIQSLDDARRAARAADHAVQRSAQDDPGQRGGMGCALALLSLRPTPADGPEWVGAHVGDVRIVSRSPDGVTRLESRDHTPAFARWEAGEIQLDEIPEAEGANRLQRAVGRGGEADVLWLPARPGWSYLLISDGVTKAMRLDELGEAMAAPSAAAGCAMIRAKVEERGPDDNYTAVIVRILPTNPPAADEATLPEPGATLPHPIADTRSLNRPMPVTQPRGTASNLVIGILAALALGVAGFALWTAWELRQAAAAERTEQQQLRTEIDSIRAEISRLADPFAPTSTPPAATAGDTIPSSTPTNRP